MANVDIEIGGRRYTVACRTGEEEHLRALGEVVDRKAQEAAGALGNLSEARQLMFASLLLADELKEKGAPEAGPGGVADEDREVAEALERLAQRMESLATRLEAGLETGASSS